MKLVSETSYTRKVRGGVDVQVLEVNGSSDWHCA